MMNLFSVLSAILLINLAAGFDLDLGINMEELGEAMKEIQSVMSMFGGADGACGKKCAPGETLIDREGHIPSFNGCGSMGAEINLTDLPQISGCCNDHDICYDTCKANRTLCDVEFQQCINNMCAEAAGKDVAESHDSSKIEEALQACQGIGTMMYQSTKLLGCEPFKKAQEQACVCVRDDDLDGDDHDEL